MPEITRKRATRAFGALLLLVWIALTYRQLIGLPKDAVARLALLIGFGVAAAVALLPGVSRRVVPLLTAPRPWVFVSLCALAAFTVSLWMVRVPMNERVFSIDGSVYLQQARALSHGHFGMPIPAPRLPFGGRFLFEGPDGRLYGVFPPGFPLFVVPFVWIGMPYLAGPVISALLVVAQWALGRAISAPARRADDEWATRLGVILSLPSFARAIETADLLSHAFAGLLCALAVAAALRALERPTGGRAVLLGACAGWAFSARLLDGAIAIVLLAGIVAVGLAQRKLGARFLIIAVLAALPFLALLAAQQKAATGSFATPTQTEYFVRSDHPTSCHRLGFGTDVGCAVEHPDSRASFGVDGYGIDDAARVTRERAGRLGEDLFGVAPILWLALMAVILRPTGRDAVAGGFVLLFTLGYGLFYYGNAPLFGARHLFPVAPFLWILLARAIDATPHRPTGWLGAWHARAMSAAFVLTVVIAAQVPRWRAGVAILRGGQGDRLDLRKVMREHDVQRGLVVTGDELSWIASFDGWADGDARKLVKFDGSGLLELRRVDPTMTLHFVLHGDQYQSTVMKPPSRGVHVELESAWPSFQRPSGLATRILWMGAPSSAERVLFVLHATEGGSIRIPFWVAQAGRYAFRVEGVVAPDFGRYQVEIDGSAQPPWEGYAAQVGHRKGALGPAAFFAAGPHMVTLRCIGRATESRGLLAAFDTLIGVPE